MSKHGELAFD